MTDFLSMLTSIPGLVSDFTGAGSNPYAKQQKQLADQQAQIAGALTNTNNPLYQQLYGQYKQQNANTMASNIAEAQGQNRMNANMGRTPLFSNERGSENIFRSMMLQQQGAGLQADQQVRQALTGAGQTTNSALQGYTNPYNGISTGARMGNAQQLQGFQGISNLLRGQTGQPQMQMPSTGSMGAGNYGGTGMDQFSQLMRQYQQPNSGMGYPTPYQGYSY